MTGTVYTTCQNIGISPPAWRRWILCPTRPARRCLCPGVSIRLMYKFCLLPYHLCPSGVKNESIEKSMHPINDINMINDVVTVNMSICMSNMHVYVTYYVCTLNYLSKEIIKYKIKQNFCARKRAECLTK